MSRLAKPVLIALGVVAMAAPVFGVPNVGRPATPAEIQAWDIDIRPDFQGLPRGSGSVRQGEKIWDQKCTSCHGTFGESNEVFAPLTGGTTKADQQSGHVKALAGPNIPPRTTFMKLSSLSTLFDYIRRAMPWNAPKSLSNDDVYAVTAYMLSLNDIVAEDFVLDQDNIKLVQQRLPNRNGMTRDHGLWSVKGKPDTANKACMRDCEKSVTITSTLPVHAAGTHGNLADQNRTFGPVRGVTLAIAGTSPAPAKSPSPSRLSLAEDNGCTGCHGVSDKIVGPAFRDIAKRYANQSDGMQRLKSKIRLGGAGAWGDMPMPPQDQIDDTEANALAEWILNGAQ